MVDKVQILQNCLIEAAHSSQLTRSLISWKCNHIRVSLEVNMWARFGRNIISCELEYITIDLTKVCESSYLDSLHDTYHMYVKSNYLYFLTLAEEEFNAFKNIFELYFFQEKLTYRWNL